MPLAIIAIDILKDLISSSQPADEFLYPALSRPIDIDPQGGLVLNLLPSKNSIIRAGLNKIIYLSCNRLFIYPCILYAHIVSFM